MDLAVLGGGCLGLSAALALAEEGHDVTLIEASQVGAGSTAKAAGIVSTMTWNDDDLGLVATTRARVGELISLAAGPIPEARMAWRPYDSITIAKGEKLAILDDMQDRLERHTEEPERLDWRAAGAEYPALSFGPGEEVLVAQEDGVLEAGDFLAALAWRCEAEGVSIEQGRGPTSVAEAASGREGVVVAAGAWTRSLLADAGVRLPVQHFRTQLASLGGLGIDVVPIVHDAVRGFYARPESEGSFLAGDGTVLQDHDPEAYNEAGDPQFIERMAECVSGRFKDGGAARVRASWAGLCVATPDRRPLCGPVPDRDDLWVLTGDNGFGLMRCMALGERLAEAVEGEAAAATDPRRFGAEGAGTAADFVMAEGFGF